MTSELDRSRPSSLVIHRPQRSVCEALAGIGTATISSELNRLGGRDCHIEGPRSLVSGRVAAGPALTLQFMPKRDDLFSDGEYDNPDLQLHRQVMYPAELGDMIVVDAGRHEERHLRRDDADLSGRSGRRRRNRRRLYP